MRKLLPFIFLIILIGLGYWAISQTLKKGQVETPYLLGSLQNSTQELLDLTSLSENQWLSVNKEFDWQIINEERTRNEELKNRLWDLTEELKILVKNLGKISEKEKREKLEKAIQYQLNCLSHLINYSQLVDSLINDLEKEEENKEIEKILATYQEKLKEEFKRAQENYQFFKERLL